MYEERCYRSLHHSELYSFQVKHEACDLWLAVPADQHSDKLQTYCQEFILKQWQELYAYIQADPAFAATLQPYKPLPNAPAAAQYMAKAAAVAAVGPMATVAGYFAQALGVDIADKFQLTDLIIENGGDIWLSSTQPRRIALHAGSSPLSNKLALEIGAVTALGVCTSSGTVGHSLSFGHADSVTVIAQDAAIADAFATAIANKINTPDDIERELAQLHSDIIGSVIILGKHIGARGNVQLVNI